MRETTRGMVATFGLAALATLLTQCSFAGVITRNARWFFSTPAPASRADRPRSDDASLSVLWVGHATVLVQLGDRYVLTDPVFTELVGGFSRRLVAAGLAADALPDDVTVVVSHRHFDHLSKDSLELIAPHTSTVLVPAGAADDVPVARYAVRELPWWQSWTDRGLRITAVPAAHEGTRWLHDAASHPRAFGGYVIEYAGRSVYFAGDTAFDPQLFAQIHARFPSLDLALLPIGPITPVEMMQPHHMDPEQAVEAFALLGARRLIPMHFATYLHSYDAPGLCEQRFDAAVAARADLAARASRIEIGQRQVVFALPAPPAAGGGP